MTRAMEREQNVYRSLLPLTGPVLADPEPTCTAPMVRGRIAMPFTACVHAVANSPRLADTAKGGELSYTALQQWNASKSCTDRYCR